MNRLVLGTLGTLVLAAVAGHANLFAGRSAARVAGASTVGNAATRAAQGRLLESQSSNHYLWLARGTRYLISGRCDRDCRDLDLRLFSPGGEEIDTDLLGDDVPVVSTTPWQSGRYRVEVIMAHCAIEPCGYELLTEER